MANLLRPLASIPHGLAVKVLKVVACVFIVYTVWMAQQLNAYKKREKAECSGVVNGYTQHGAGGLKRLSCSPRHYSSLMAAECFRNSRVQFMGSSQMRTMFSKTVDYVKTAPDHPVYISTKGTALKRRNHEYNFTDIPSSFHFTYLPFVYPKWANAMKDFDEASQKSDLIVISAGLWKGNADPSLADMEKYIRILKSTLPVVSSIVQSSGTKLIWIKNPLNANDNAQQIKQVSDIWSRYEADDMYLLDPRRVRLVHGDVHYGDADYDTITQAIMNIYCNSGIPPATPHLCCQPWSLKLTTVQVMLLVFCIIGAVYWTAEQLWQALARSISQPTSSNTTPTSKSGHLPAGVSPLSAICQCITLLGIVLLYTYLADRTPVFTKEEKHFNWTSFAVPLAILGILGFVTYQPVKDASVLNRQQTCETRGWMQLVLLVYHYTGGSKVLGLYYVVRLIVAMYIFLSAFGHYTYGLKRGASSWSRVAEVLFRLNLYTVLLCLTMDVPYLHYYFVPLISACYLLVLLVAAIPPVAWNQDTSPWMQMIKAVCLAMVLGVYRMLPGPFNTAIMFTPLRYLLLDDNHSLREWTFRFSLDILAVPTGIVCAVFMHRFPDRSKWIVSGSKTASVMTFLSALIIALYCGLMAMSCTSRKACYPVHTYASPVVLIGFVLVRNTWEPLRKHYSQFFDWVGIYSLELFIAQYHVLLANDTRSLLVLVEGNPILNICIVTTIFVLVSHTVAECTQMLVSVMNGVTAQENE
eukprot:scpid31965/ scgid5533/ CAS1 domain-containing protein 1